MDFEELKNSENRGVFRTQSHIYDGFFFAKIATRSDVRLGSENASGKHLSFVIYMLCAAPIRNPCPNLKSLLPRFVISAPI